MRFFLYVLSLSLFSSVNAKDYIWKSSGKRTIITEHKYSYNSNFRGYKIEGTFTDNIGNYGEWDTYVFAVISNGKISKLEFSLTLVEGFILGYDLFRVKNTNYPLILKNKHSQKRILGFIVYNYNQEIINIIRYV